MFYPNGVDFPRQMSEQRCACALMDYIGSKRRLTVFGRRGFSVALLGINGPAFRFLQPPGLQSPRLSP
jgi:hypothetical protein